MTFEEIWQSIKSWLISDALWTTLLKIVISLIVMLISYKIINAISRRIERRGNDKRADKTIMKTFAYIFRIGMKILVAICLIGFLGIDTSGLTALVASFGVCIGLAVNGAVANIAGGVLLIFTRPFRVDDYIEAQGYSGTVTDIRLTCTKLVTPDNKVVYVPNGALANGNIVNYSEKDMRRVDMIFSIGYGDDFAKAQNILMQLCLNHELVLKEPAPFVRMDAQASSSVNITVRVWVNNADYWTVYFDLLEGAKKAFDENGIEIPFNQIDVHVKND